MKRKNIKTIVCLVATLACGLSQADDGWVKVRDDKAVYIGIQKGSFKFDKNKDGDSVASINIKMEEKKKADISFHKAYVTFDDCNNRAGVIYVLDVSGKEVLFTWDFAYDGGTYASLIGEAVCEIASDKYNKLLNETQPEAKTPALEGKGL